MTKDLSEELRIAIAKAGGQKIIASKLGISEADLSRKISGERGWKISDLQKLFELTELHLAAGGDQGSGDFALIMELSRKLTETMRMLDEARSRKEKTNQGDSK